jgi:signal transduction histidine kinase
MSREIHLSETDAGRSAEPTAVAWLAFEAEPGRLAQLGREPCLAMANAVLSTAAGRGRPYGLPPTLMERLTAVAGRAVEVAAWLATVPKTPTEVAASTAPAAGRDDARLLLQLAEAVVLPGDERSPPEDRGRVPGPEATVLREALQLATAHVQLREHFDRAVAEARLEAMRELAYGAGHEINNPLANIATRAQALLLEETDPERRRRLSTIVDQSFRARDMIGGLMLFARPPKPRLEPVDLGGMIAAVIESVRGQAAARGGRLEYSPPPVPLSVSVDRVQLEEAIRVVVVNALEAVAAGGRVVLEANRRSMESGGGCEVTVADNGRGMSFEAARKAFDPFYSGREAGRGAGLGLSKAWRLVEASGGTILLESRPGQGTRVSLLLPEASAIEARVPGAGAGLAAKSPHLS